ncbi:DUF2339 domain-containing protein [Curvibacter sp. APW13]|uniref:DUF2339 domain-containing protein n=1 Tax=Curvibacter sp. APW13 TaxID=3077236 RepID=UPI0028DEE18D|nr:DUF2339 domain-containing protein [Curvibacter sp. APW13]MDT8991368.1 DUF2339 domain-containing protein [Curvibacter sp. APW13]
MVWLLTLAGFLTGVAAEGAGGALIGALVGWIIGRSLMGHIEQMVRKEVALRMREHAAATAAATAAARATPVTQAAQAESAAPPTASTRVTVDTEVAQPTPAKPAAPRPPADAEPEDAFDRWVQHAPAAAASPVNTPTPAAAPARSTAPPATGPDLSDNFDRLASQVQQWIFGGNTVLRLGLLMLFVGLAFLAKYSIDHALLPPEVRLAGIGLVALVLFGLGWRQRNDETRTSYALSLQGAGVGVLYLTIFAAFRLYQLLPAGPTFALLALVCVLSTAIALLQNAQTMAFIGFAGAFAAPVLASTGQGDHVGLFSYYALLNCGIVAVAALRAWRPLNLLGFFATFGVATAWGVLQYRAEHLGTTLPFLALFFGQYLLAAWWYALRHGLPQQRAVDATLVFGNPIVSMGLLAHMVWDIPYASAAGALGLAAWYLVVGFWTLKRHPGPTASWLVECCVALALGFATLAVPLALDGRWVSAAWAAEGAAVFWIGLRQQRWLARLAGSALQGFAAFSYLQSLDFSPEPALHFANPTFVGAVLLAASGAAIAWLSHCYNGPATTRTSWNTPYLDLEAHWPRVFGAWGFLWWQAALWSEIERVPHDGTSGWMAVPPDYYLGLLAWVLSAWAVHFLARPGRANPWVDAAWPALLSMPYMLLSAIDALESQGYALQSGGWWLWPLVLAAHLHTLRHADALPPTTAWSWVHSAGVWLLMLLGGNLLYWGVDQAGLWHTAWATVVMLAAGSAVVLALASEGLHTPLGPWRQRWPLQTQAYAYLWRGAAPVALLVLLGALAVALTSRGNTAPLPYVPLLNPTDLSVALGLAVTALWMRRVRASSLPLPALAFEPAWKMAWLAVAFVAINTVWLRIAHHFGGVAWEADTLFASFLVQAGYSLLWTLLALALMLTAHRRQQRTLWMGGAALLGLTVLKLLLIDLSNRGGGERIVTFIGVGVIMLVIGYFAPLPPAQQPSKESRA